MGLVSIVVVTWNSAQDLPRCLEGIRAQTHREIELIAVDNASDDHSASFFERVIRNDTNRGFSAAVNQALAVARGEFVLLLNPDCFLAPDYIERLLPVFDDARTGAATGLLYRESGEGVDSAGIRMTRNGRHLDIDVAPAERTEVF